MIVGVLGFAGSGKGTVADILVGKGFKKESFADPVKDAVAAIFGWDRALLEGDTKESRDFREKPDKFWSDRTGYSVTPRYMLQLMGTEAGRDVFHTDIWVHSLLRRAERNANTVIADVRFPNEMDAIKKAGGHLVVVQRGNKPEWYCDAMIVNEPGDYMEEDYEKAKIAMEQSGVHYSEWAWIGNNEQIPTIMNDGSLEELQKETENILHFFKYSDIMLD